MVVGIYHSRDLDGWCSAAIIKKRYPEATLIGFDYGNSFEDLLAKISPDDEVIMADVSLPMTDMAELADHVYGNFSWIDHHASAIADYNAFVEQERLNLGGVSFLEAILEDGISACEGTWKHLFPGELMPRAVELLGEYDTWRNNDKHRWDYEILPFQYGMRLRTSSPETFDISLLAPNVTADDIVEVIRRGNVILTYQRQQNIVSMKKAFVIDFHGLRCLACNGGSGSTSFESVWNPELHDLMMTFKYMGDKWVFGIYTDKEDINLTALAKLHGGGGHVKAAGFQYDNIPPFIFQMNKVSDGYHTFDELYDHRITLYIALMKIKAVTSDQKVWRTITHSDGSVWDGWFVLGYSVIPGRQVTYHLPMNRWTECEFAEVLSNAPDWDGHDSAEVLRRIKLL